MRKAKHREKPPPLRLSRPDNKIDDERLAMAAHMQNKQPLIIHTFSPEIIHSNAHDFMNLVQRLTGKAVSHVTSPLAKRPRLQSPHMPPQLHPHTMAAPRHPAFRQEPPLEIQHEQQSRISELASRRELSPRVRLGLQLEMALSPRGRAGSGTGAGTPVGALVKSPLVFDFSPSSLPTPHAFLHDFPSLSSPYVHAEGLPLSPLSVKAGAACRSVMMMPAVLPSPGPLTSAFFAELPALSPAAHGWIEKHPWSAELMLSPLSRGFGLPPKSPPADGY